MGTTTVVIYAAEGRIYLGNVGDSRGYLLRGGLYRQVTQDHSLWEHPCRRHFAGSGQDPSHAQRDYSVGRISGRGG